MATLKSENFDGVTAPAFPAPGWVRGANVVTTTGGFVSAANGATNDTGAIDQIAFYQRWPDSNQGNHEVSATVWATAASGASNVELLGRITRASGTARTGLTCYSAKTDFVFGTHGISLIKYVAGTPTTIINVSSVNINLTDKFIVTLSTINTTITVRCQRVVDGFWMDNAGNFAGGQVNCISQSDSTVKGYGNAGFALNRTILGVDICFLDDWLWVSVPPLIPRPHRLINLHNQMRLS
jgi:hypothetical protein